MKWEVGCAMVSTTTSIGLLIYIVYTRPPNKPLGAGPRDVYLKMLCQSLNSLPPEEWEKVRAKLDVFLGVSPPPVLQLTKTVVEVEEKEMMTSNNVVAPFPSLPSSPVEEEKGEDDSVVAGFRKMLKMGIPPQAVRNKMMQEKIDPALLFGNEASVEGIRSPERRSNANHSVTTTIAKTMPSPILLFPVEVVSMDSTNGLFCQPLLKGVVDEDVAQAIQQLFHSKSKPPTRSIAPLPSSPLENDENIAPSTTSLIPPRRAQNIQIGLIKLKRPTEDICYGISNMHTHSLDDLQLLVHLLPTLEEVKLVTRIASSIPQQQLGTVDRFVYVIGTQCQDARERVQCLLFLEQNQIQELMDVVQEMITFCDLIIQQSKQFAQLLNAASVVAFALNQTPFNLESVSICNLGVNLLKTKTKNGKITAAHLVAIQFQGNEQELTDQFPLTTATPFPPITAVDAQLRMLNRELDKCTAYMPQTMNPKHGQALNTVQQRVVALKLVYAQVLCGFGLAVDYAFPQFVQDVLGLVNCLRRPPNSNWVVREQVRLAIV